MFSLRRMANRVVKASTQCFVTGRRDGVSSVLEITHNIFLMQQKTGLMAMFIIFHLQVCLVNFLPKYIIAPMHLSMNTTMHSVAATTLQNNCNKVFLCNINQDT